MSLRAPVTVAVVEDHPEFRDALCTALAQVPGVQLLGVCKDQPAGLQLLQRTCPDVLLVDLGLPSGSGLALIRAAQQRWGTRCTSAVLTVTGNEEHMLTAVGAGAKGYLFKSDQAAEWCRTTVLLAQGQSPLHAGLAQEFLRHASASASASAPRHGTSGECEALAAAVLPEAPARSLLQHIAAGYTCAEAAPKLGMSLADAGLQLRRVYQLFHQRGPELSQRELELLQLLNRGFAFKKCAELMGVSESTTKTHATRAYQKLGATNLQTALYEARVAGLLA